MGCAVDMPQVFTHFLSKSVVNFVLKELEGRCGRCGIENEGDKLNKFPWYVAIKEKDNEKFVFHTGTLVSKEHIVTAASIFKHTPIQKENFQALVGATAYEVNVANVYPEGFNPFISKY